MKRLAVWLLMSALSLMCTNAFADLSLSLHTDGLSPAQQKASQTLLDEAMAHLPPLFVSKLDRKIEVH